MRLHWTPEAKAQLRAIEAYIAKDSPAAAKRTIGRIAQRCRQAAELPNSGRQVIEFPRADLRELLERPYRILYRIREEQVDIVTIWHYRRILRTLP
jgi:toxin ParE1/3/4